MDYITLVSDSSSDIFPDNRISHFRVKLPKKIPLSRFDDQIGHKYISFPYKSNNIEDGNFSIYFINIRNASGALPELPQIFDTKIDSGYYNRPIDLINAMNKKIDNILNDFRERFEFSMRTMGIVFPPMPEGGWLSYNEASGHVTLRSLNEEEWALRLEFSRELFIKLGIGLESEYHTAHSPRGRRLFEQGHTSKYTVDLDIGKNSVFVYTDIIEADRIAGNSLCNLLVSVPFSGMRGKQSHFEPHIIEYHQPRFSLIDEIEIKLCGDTGEVIPFTGGKVFLTLHIKRNNIII